MKSTISLALVPLLTLGCGSAPAAPTATPSPSAPRAVAVSMLVVPSGLNGFTPPTSLTLRLAMPPIASTPIESASFRMVDAQGQTLAEASLMATAMGPPDPDQYLSAGAIVQTLRWPPERGLGSRIDVTLGYRDAAGVLSTHSFSIPAR